MDNQEWIDWLKKRLFAVQGHLHSKYDDTIQSYWRGKRDAYQAILAKMQEQQEDDA